MVNYCLCHSDSASVLLYLIVSSLLTIVPFAVRGWYLSYVLYPSGVRIHYTTNLYLQVTDIAGIHSCTRYAYSSSASGFLGVSVGPLFVHCCLCHSDSASVLLNVPILCTSTYTCGAGSTVPREGFDSCLIMPFS